MCDSLGRGEELTLFLDMLSVSTRQGTGAVRLFPVDTLDQLVQIKGNAQFLDRVTIGIDDEVVAFLIEHPEFPFS